MIQMPEQIMQFNERNPQNLVFLGPTGVPGPHVGAPFIDTY